ncbi:hypothetical protein BN2476_630122 [Paraburkholderia piptadeniae]|uniref:Uncharacterized protein n=1 Tax=Paraburkholderia piptadeniae TaxID=1701573 RepID=A0A1N7SLP1_9BURK|nr:hypothetical protein BN2476_630122 [Paraburkholderia piptadeniae]
MLLDLKDEKGPIVGHELGSVEKVMFC